MRIPSFKGVGAALLTILLVLAVCYGVTWVVSTAVLEGNASPWIIGTVAGALLMLALAAGWRRRRPGQTAAGTSLSLLRSLAVIALLLLGCLGLFVVLGFLGFHA